MELMLIAALKYKNELGYSVIPVRPMDKKPDVIKWDDFKNRIASDEEVRGWWSKNPGANVGIVTGKVSGISVIDIDTPEAEIALFEVIPESIITPTAMTPRGGKHMFFKYDPRVPSVSSKVIKNVDTKSDGGMVVAAPSTRPEGKYVWVEGLKPTQVDYAPFPEAYIQLIEAAKKKPINTDHIEIVQMFEHGKRDESLFHVANQLMKSHTPSGEIYQILEALIRSWGEEPDPKWIAQKVESAMKRASTRDRDITSEVKQWVILQDGIFRLDGCYGELALLTKEHKAEARATISELAKQGLICRDKGLNIYRPVKQDIDFIAIPDEEQPAIDFKFPLGINAHVEVRERNVIIVAGTSNSGKTAMCLNLAMRNMDKHRIRYQSSEMTGDELFIKLKHMPRTLDDFRAKVEWINRSSDWWDLIIPDAVNIIDFMEIYENFYEVGGWIKKVHDKLTTGLAIIALQKRDSMTDTGRGGAITKEKARLYLSMDYGKLTMTKVKHWASHEDPNNKCVQFTLDKGVNFQSIGLWQKVEPKGGQ